VAKCPAPSTIGERRGKLAGDDYTISPTGSSPAFFQGRHATNHWIAAAEVTLYSELEGIIEQSTITVVPGPLPSLAKSVRLEQSSRLTGPAKVPACAIHENRERVIERRRYRKGDISGEKPFIPVNRLGIRRPDKSKFRMHRVEDEISFSSLRDHIRHLKNRCSLFLNPLISENS
jgi:hypothetical protein